MAAAILVSGAASGSGQPLFDAQWEEAAPQGFGDRHNSLAWSMQWWRGKLYVGTQRSFICWRAAIWAAAAPGLASAIYPPRHADAECTESPTDLPMQAEIWRWTPETEAWERVYQSPQDVPIPGHPGKYVARDVGYRGMLVFEEADGIEALYVAGVSAREMYTQTEQLPPPRLLRSTDGVTFEPVPQTPGTYLGELPDTGLRTGTIHNGRMYLTHGNSRGEGILIEAQEPAGGNDNFRPVMPPGTKVWDAISFNGFLYVGVVTPKGFSVVKTDALGAPPYAFTTVITAGGYLKNPSLSVVSLEAYQGRLYVGTIVPAELYRINPDDTWDLLIGEARETPTGWKYPLSGLDPGFGWPYNIQIYRMQAHDGALYLGTLDVSREVTEAWPDPSLDARLRWHYGFDLYRTVEGQFFEPLTINGFGDGFQIAARTFASTPFGQFLGTGSYWYGFRIWRQLPELRIYLPLISANAAGPVTAQASGWQTSAVSHPESAPACAASPERAEAESVGGHIVLAWDRPHAAARSRIFRSEYETRRLAPGAFDPASALPTPFVEIGSSDTFFFVDPTARPGQIYYYVVAAEGEAGCLSPPSNLVRAPSLAPAITLTGLRKTVDEWRGGAESSSPADGTEDVLEALRGLGAALERGEMVEALSQLGAIRMNLAARAPSGFPQWRIEDLDAMLARLERRIRLADAGLIPLSALK